MDLSLPLLHHNESVIQFPGQGRQWCPKKHLVQCTQHYFDCHYSKIAAIPSNVVKKCYKETFCLLLKQFSEQLDNWVQGSWVLTYKIKKVYGHLLRGEVYLCHLKIPFPEL